MIGVFIWLTACGGSSNNPAPESSILYVDNRSSGGSGTANAPFATLAQAQLVAGDGDTIYVANGDGTSTGLDTGLVLDLANISVIGEGVALVVDGVTLVAAGTAPTITNATGAGITLNAADNILIAGLTIDGVASDGLVINDSTAVRLQAVIISNSGRSAIKGAGADVGLTLSDVTIDTVDVVNPSVSDDAIHIAATTSSSLVMSGGTINGVPGNLGDGIVLKNTDTANPVTMNLDIRGVNFSNIAQDGIKLENNNGVAQVRIGGATALEGNIFDVGFRGIKIQTDADPTLNRINRILIQNNSIISTNEGVQIRSVADRTNLSILDNVLSRGLAAVSKDLIDLQAESSSTTQARINRNEINNLTGSDGVKIRVFDAATLTMEAFNNSIDGPLEGFDFDVIETNAGAIDNTTLNASVLNNTLTTIADQAMNAGNANATSSICMDLQGNTTAPPDYVADVALGSFMLTAASQTIVFASGSSMGVGPCPLPVF